MKKNLVRRIFTAFFLMGIMSIVTFSYRWAQRSPLFTLTEMSWIDYPSQAPFEKEIIQSLIEPPINQVNLFDLDLEPMKKRVLTHPWVKNITLSKIFPNAVGVYVEFREPVGLLQSPDGELNYLDREGNVFGPFEPKRVSDLPTLVGFKETDTKLILSGLKLIEDWRSSKFRHVGVISSLSYDPENGFRFILRYGKRGRAVVEQGHELASIDSSSMENLASTISYLENRSTDAYQIFVGNGKKIVVRTHPGS